MSKIKPITQTENETSEKYYELMRRRNRFVSSKIKNGRFKDLLLSNQIEESKDIIIARRGEKSISLNARKLFNL